jgi:hypothetical protein
VSGVDPRRQGSRAVHLIRNGVLGPAASATSPGYPLQTRNALNVADMAGDNLLPELTKQSHKTPRQPQHEHSGILFPVLLFWAVGEGNNAAATRQHMHMTGVTPHTTESLWRVPLLCALLLTSSCGHMDIEPDPWDPAKRQTGAEVWSEAELQHQLKPLQQGGAGIFYVDATGIAAVDGFGPAPPQTSPPVTRIQEGLFSARTAPDGRVLAGLDSPYATFPHRLLCYRSTGQLLARIELPAGCLGVAVAPDAEHFLVRFPDVLRLIDSSGEPQWELAIRKDAPSEQGVHIPDDRHLRWVRPGLVFDQRNFFAQSMTWEPNGKHFAWSDRERVHVVRTSDRAEVATWCGRSPTWAPDGTELAYLRGESAFLRQVPDGAERPLLPGRRFVCALEWSPCSRFLLGKAHWRCPERPLWESLGDLDQTDCYPLVVIARKSQASARVRELPGFDLAPQYFWLDLSP